MDDWHSSEKGYKPSTHVTIIYLIRPIISIHLVHAK